MTAVTSSSETVTAASGAWLSNTWRRNASASSFPFVVSGIDSNTTTRPGIRYAGNIAANSIVS